MQSKNRGLSNARVCESRTGENPYSVGRRVFWRVARGRAACTCVSTSNALSAGCSRSLYIYKLKEKAHNYQGKPTARYLINSITMASTSKFVVIFGILFFSCRCRAPQEMSTTSWHWCRWMDSSRERRARGPAKCWRRFSWMIFLEPYLLWVKPLPNFMYCGRACWCVMVHSRRIISYGRVRHRFHLRMSRNPRCPWMSRDPRRP